MPKLVLLWVSEPQWHRSFPVSKAQLSIDDDSIGNGVAAVVSILYDELLLYRIFESVSWIGWCEVVAFTNSVDSCDSYAASFSSSVKFLNFNIR